MDNMIFSAKIVNQAFNGVHDIFEITPFITMTEHAIALSLWC